MDSYLIDYDFQQKIRDAQKHGYLISTEEYIADIQQLLDFIQEMAAPYEERILALEMDIADLQNSGGCDCITDDYDDGKEAGFQDGYDKGRAEGIKWIRERVRKALQFS